MSETTKSQKFLVRVPIEEKFGVEQKGRMKVGSQIIRHLSRGIYSTPAMAIKELISNAFDADAPEVKIETKKGGTSIIIHDTGTGMDYHDFDENFTYISKSQKHSKDEKTPLGRPMIGRLGIGFLAVSELCNTMIISSAKKGANTKFIATIDFSKFKDKRFEQSDFNDISEYTLTNFPKEDIKESYTHIELLNLSEGFRNILSNISTKRAVHKQFKQTTFKEVVKEIWDTTVHLNIDQAYGPYWKFVIDLASIIPIEYLKEGPIRHPQKIDYIENIKNNVSSLKFKVFFDNMELRKPYLLPTLNKLEDGNYTILPFSAERLASNGNVVKYSGYMYSQDGGILVDDWRGLIVRIKNTSIGIVQHDFLGYPYEGDSLYYKWTFGEIYVEDGLDDAMNIDRATFKTADPEYFAFIDSLHTKLKKEVFNSVQIRWRERTKEKREDLENRKEKWRRSSAKKVFNKDFQIILTEDLDAKPVTIDLHKKILEINPLNEVLATFPIREKKFLQDILFAVALSREKYPTNPKKQDDLLLELLEDLGKKYPKPIGRKKSKEKK